MAETFVITVLSFGLVLAVVAALLVWVILPALNEEDEESKTKELTLADYIDDINRINESAYNYDTDQQKAINANANAIKELQGDTTTASASASASASGGAVSTATEASADFDNGVWTIKQGPITYKATPTHMCDDEGDDCAEITMTTSSTAESSATESSTTS